MDYDNGAIVTIPDVLINYLYDLIGADCNVLFVRLVPAELGNGLVQDIILETRDNAETRRVFGFKPINTRLQVTRGDNAAPSLTELAAA